MATTEILPNKNYSASLQTEVDAAFLYERIAAAEEVPAIASMFRELGAIEHEHATKMETSLRNKGIAIALPRPPGAPVCWTGSERSLGMAM